MVEPSHGVDKPPASSMVYADLDKVQAEICHFIAPAPGFEFPTVFKAFFFLCHRDSITGFKGKELLSVVLRIVLATLENPQPFQIAEIDKRPFGMLAYALAALIVAFDSIPPLESTRKPFGTKTRCVRNDTQINERYGRSIVRFGRNQSAKQLSFIQAQLFEQLDKTGMSILGGSVIHRRKKKLRIHLPQLSAVVAVGKLLNSRYGNVRGRLHEMLLGNAIRPFPNGFNGAPDALFSVYDPFLPTTQPHADGSGHETNRVTQRFGRRMNEVVVSLAKHGAVRDTLCNLLIHSCSIPAMKGVKLHAPVGQDGLHHFSPPEIDLK